MDLKVCSLNHPLDIVPGCEPNGIDTRKMKAAEHICAKIKSLWVANVNRVDSMSRNNHHLQRVQRRSVLYKPPKD